MTETTQPDTNFEPPQVVGPQPHHQQQPAPPPGLIPQVQQPPPPPGLTPQPPQAPAGPSPWGQPVAPNPKSGSVMKIILMVFGAIFLLLILLGVFAMLVGDDPQADPVATESSEPADDADEPGGATAPTGDAAPTPTGDVAAEHIETFGPATAYLHQQVGDYELVAIQNENILDTAASDSAPPAIVADYEASDGAELVHEIALFATVPTAEDHVDVQAADLRDRGMEEIDRGEVLIDGEPVGVYVHMRNDAGYEAIWWNNGSLLGGVGADGEAAHDFFLGIDY